LKKLSRLAYRVVTAAKDDISRVSKRRNGCQRTDIATNSARARSGRCARANTTSIKSIFENNRRRRRLTLSDSFFELKRASAFAQPIQKTRRGRRTRGFISFSLPAEFCRKCIGCSDRSIRARASLNSRRLSEALLLLARNRETRNLSLTSPHPFVSPFHPIPSRSAAANPVTRSLRAICASSFTSFIHAALSFLLLLLLLLLILRIRAT